MSRRNYCRHDSNARSRVMIAVITRAIKAVNERVRCCDNNNNVFMYYYYYYRTRYVSYPYGARMTARDDSRRGKTSLEKKLCRVACVWPGFHYISFRNVREKKKENGFRKNTHLYVYTYYYHVQ